MKKFGLLLIAMVVLFSLFAACSNDETEATDVFASAEGETLGGLLESLGLARELNSALSNFEAEVSQRIETTPFQAFVLLADALEYGTTNVSFAYIDEMDGWGDGNVTVNASILSNAEAMEFALRGDVEFEGVNVDFSMALNEERLAVGSSVLGEDYYGVMFATFAEDLPRLLEEMGFDLAENFELAMIFSSIVEYLELVFRLEEDSWEEQSWEVIFNFIRSAAQTPEDVDGGRRIAYTFTMADLADFIREYYEFIMSNDDFMSIYDIPLFSDALGTTSADAEEMFEAMLEEIAVLEDVNGELTVAFYIGERDRLLRIGMDGAFEYDGEEVELSAVFDFGENATDTWTLTAQATDGFDTYSFEMAWEIGEIGGRHVHEFAVEAMGENVTLTTEWNPTNGDFAIFAGLPEVGRAEVFGGNLTMSGGTFRLLWEHMETGDNWRYGFMLDISTERGANIGNIDFVNIADLSFEDLEGIAVNVMENIMGFGFDASAPVWDFEDDWDDIVYLNHPLNGEWVWDMDDTYIYVFTGYGDGARGFLPDIYNFAWTTYEGTLMIEVFAHGEIMDGTNFPISFEFWDYVIAGDVLTITSQQVAGLTFSYIRVR
ncbi:MAG: hypothetical protein FWB96_10035 [Defluviitaleaceae bacterium]|nr:hypothetical protein [Defluviitaleaceae bacterium]MCL2263210.1 hypothetical protein [Defluviitaleaceae bacterium]